MSVGVTKGIKISFIEFQQRVIKPETVFQTVTHKKKVQLWRGETYHQFFALETTVEQDLLLTTTFPKSFNPIFRVLKWTTAFIGRGMTYGEIPVGPNEKVPDYLEIVGTKVHAVSQTPTICCLEITIPLNEKAGNITQQIVLGSQILNLEVVVLPLLFTKLEPKQFSLELWEYPYAVGRYYGLKTKELFEEKHERLVKNNLLTYQKWGGDVIATTIVHEPWNHQTFDSTPSLIDWQYVDEIFLFNFSRFDTYVQWNLDVGITGKIKCFSILPWENQISFWTADGSFLREKLTVGSQRWQMIWLCFLRAFINHLEEKNWLDRAYLAIDERPREEVKAVLDLVQQVRSTQGKTIKLAGTFNYQVGNDEIFDFIDDLSLSQAHIKDVQSFRKFAKKRALQAQTTTIYNCVGDYPSLFSRSQPIEAAYLIWFIAALGGDGFLRWALDAWGANPCETISHWYWESGDPFLIYPSSAKQQISLTPRAIQMSQAIWQVRKYRYLKMENEQLVTEIEKELRDWPLPKGQMNEFGAMEMGNPGDTIFFSKRVNQIMALLHRAEQEFIS
jgi:hypothetical protein